MSKCGVCIVNIIKSDSCIRPYQDVAITYGQNKKKGELRTGRTWVGCFLNKKTLQSIIESGRVDNP